MKYLSLILVLCLALFACKGKQAAPPAPTVVEAPKADPDVPVLTDAEKSKWMETII
jgi:hypothetical protein